MKSQWENRKFKNKFTGSYSWFDGERTFKLSGIVGSKKRNITFESWQMAKSNGWRKCK